MNVVVEIELYEYLRKSAFEQRTSMSKLINNFIKGGMENENKNR